jgi:uncharacterized damage-inducible protein DinB
MKDALQLSQYNSWANEKIFEHLKELPDEVYEKEVQNAFSSISAVLHHMYQTDYVWLKVLEGESFEAIVASVKKRAIEIQGIDLNEMHLNFKDMSEIFKTFIQQKGDLNSPTTVHHPAIGTLHTTYDDLLQHIVNHGTYHRGHLSAILNQLGHKGASTDYIFYLFSLQHQ